MIYDLTTPPEGEQCDTPGDATIAAVRLVIPDLRFEADGVDHATDPAAMDLCDHCWSRIRQNLLSMGHKIVDTSGNLNLLMAEHRDWRVFYSDEGRLYASAQRHGSPQRMTVFAWTVAALRAEMEGAEAAMTPLPLPGCTT